MVQRRLLTWDFVNEIKPPLQGELWIADTKQPGFGLRLWSTAKGGQKAYNIRIRDQSGKGVRKTFNPEENSKHRGVWRIEQSLGGSLDDARVWARDEIDKLKGRRTLAEEEEEQSAYKGRLGQRLQGYTGRKFFLIVLKGMRWNGVSELEIRKLTKLFFHASFQEYRSRTISQINPRRLFADICSLELPLADLIWVVELV